MASKFYDGLLDDKVGSIQLLAELLVWTNSRSPLLHCTMEKYADKLEFLIKALWIAHFKEWIAQL